MARYDKTRNKSGETLSVLDLGKAGATVRNHELGREVARTGTYEAGKAKMNELAKENPTRTDADYDE